MARAAHPVLHSLPRDRRALETRVALSEDSFRAEVDFPGEEFYLFVLEDSETGTLLGTSSIVASAGYSEPFYAFRNDALIHASRELKVNRKIHALTMSHELTGKSRLTGFYIDPSLRDEANEAAAHLLSRARMIYIAANRKRFSSEVFSLMLGVTDDAGVVAVLGSGRPQVLRPRLRAGRIGVGRTQPHVHRGSDAELSALCAACCPAEAQRVLGEPDEGTLLAYDIHLEEGFEPDRFVDIFDAGPVLTIAVERSASVDDQRDCARCATARPKAGAPYLVAAGGAHAFRCIARGLCRPRAPTARR